MMLNALRAGYPNLEYGEYYHSADSMHVYQRHFEMLEVLASSVWRSDRSNEYSLVLCPAMAGPGEVEFLRAGDFAQIPEQFKFSEWLNDI